MRTTGSLRVVLNTKLWPEMICEKVNEKNIRISATDNDFIRYRGTYLIIGLILIFMLFAIHFCIKYDLGLDLTTLHIDSKSSGLSELKGSPSVLL